MKDGHGGHEVLRPPDLLTRRLEQILKIEQAAREQLALFNRLKQDFLANISHELRTPITTMQGYLSLLEQQELGPLHPEQLEAIEIVRRNLDRLNSLVGNLITLAMVTRGQLQMKSEPVDLADILRHALRRVTGSAERRGVTVDRHLADSLGRIDGDPDKLLFIIEHLLENAIKFSHPGRSITLAAYQRGAEALIEVRDTGIGMTREQLAHVLTPFMQGESGLARRYGGLGVGLTLIDHLVSLHRGELAIQSEPGVGTTVLLSLPLLHESSPDLDDREKKA